MEKLEIQHCIEVLKQGGVIIYPSDTIWGLGCDATNEQAVSKVFEIKKRSEIKSLITLVSSEAMLNKYVQEVPEQAWDLMDCNTDPITIIYPEAKLIAHNAIQNDKSIAVRIVKNGFANELIHKFNKPIISTSANISGSPTPLEFDKIDNLILEQVDYVVNLHVENKRSLSPIVKIGYGGEIEIIRK